VSKENSRAGYNYSKTNKQIQKDLESLLEQNKKEEQIKKEEQNSKEETGTSKTLTDSPFKNGLGKKYYHSSAISNKNSTSLFKSINPLIKKIYSYYTNSLIKRSFTSSSKTVNDLYFDIVHRTKNNSVKLFLEDYSNNPMYTRIKDILIENDLTSYQKQEKIEETLTSF